MRARCAALVAALLVLAGIGCSAASSATCTALAIPNPLTVDYTAPAGTYCPGPQSTVRGTVTADLTAATIIGSGTGYLFRPAADAVFTLKAGTVQNMAGLVIGTGLTAGQRASVTIDGGNLTGVTSGFLYKANDGGRVDVTMTGVTGTGMGAGVRTFGSVTASGNHLTGGGNPSSGDPVGFRALDLNDTGTPVADQTLTLTDNVVEGFVGGNSDDAGGEETVDLAVVTGNTFGTAGDAQLDLKVATGFVLDNVFTGLPGEFGRQMAVHAGVTYTGGNVFVTPDGVESIEATGTVYSDHDTFELTGSALAAKAEVACTGSTGFTGPRAGAVTIRRWLSSTDPLPARAVNGACSGVPYTPTVTLIP